MMAKLFIDDDVEIENRQAPPGWIWTHSGPASIEMLEGFRRMGEPFEAISLDHDLGGEDNTRKVVYWMIENDFWPQKIYIHTGNPAGRDWLVGMVRRYGPPGALQGRSPGYWFSGYDPN